MRSDEVVKKVKDLFNGLRHIETCHTIQVLNLRGDFVEK
jgi:hypothetical protein